MTNKIEVSVKAFGGLRTYINQFPLRIKLSAGASLHDLLAAVATLTPQLHSKITAGLADGYINILVDGRNVRFLAGLDTELRDGANVAFIPPVGGG